MIYLIQDCYKDSNNNYHDILKIGYSKDDFNSIRKPAYDTHNYGYTLLYQREGSIELEKYLHRKFKSLLLSNSTEWFSYSQDIIDSFNNITEEDILKEDYVISKEEYIEMCREYILSYLIPSSEDQYGKYLDQLLSDLKDLYENSYKDILLWEEDIYKKFFKEGLRYIENSRKSFWKNYDFKEELNDLPQNINLSENPWKNRAEFYYKSLNSDNFKNKEDFNKHIQEKLKRTNDLLNSYKDTRQEAKHTLADTYQYVAKSANYRDNYVAVNTHAGKDLVPVLNNLVMIAEQRAFDIQQIDYKDRFTVFNSLCGNGFVDYTMSNNIFQFLSEFNNNCKDNYDRLKLLCEYDLTENELSVVLDQIPLQFKTYYQTAGPQKCKSLGYNVTKINKAISDLQFDVSKLQDEIYNLFKLNERYTKASIKQTLSSLYSFLGYNKTPKANDLEEYFNLKLVDIPNKETGKKDKGFLILSKKED